MGRCSFPLALGLLLAGCNTHTVLPAEGDGGTGPDATASAARLEVLPPTDLTLGFEEQATVSVRYTENDGTPIAESAVRFGLEGTAHDSSLDALTATTDADGLASVHVIGGTTVATFRVRVSADRAAPAYVDVAVSDSGFGSLRAKLHYDGSRTLATRTVALFADTHCTDPRVQGAGSDRYGRLPDEAEDHLFVGLPAGGTYAVVGRGEGPDGAVLAYACVDGVHVTQGAEAEADLDLSDVALVTDGDYASALSIDATEVGTATAEIARTSAMADIDRAGGDAPFLLDAVETAMRNAGRGAAADALSAGRLGGETESSLASALSASSRGPSVAITNVAATLGDYLSQVTVAGQLSIDTSGATTPVVWTTGTVAVGAGGPDSPRLPLDLSPFGVEPAGMLLAHLMSSRSALAFDDLSLVLPLGTLGKATLAGMAASRHLDSTAALLMDQAGCDVLSSWGASEPTIGPACNAACLSDACNAALEQVSSDMSGALDAVDDMRKTVELRGSADLVDSNSNLRVDRITSSNLTGSWWGTGGGEGSVTASFSAARAVP